MEYLPSRNTSSSFWPRSTDWWIWVGVCTGLVLLAISELEFKWFAVLFIGLLLGFAGLFYIDKKEFFLTLLILTLPINVHINFYYQPSEISHSSYGFQILLLHLPLLALYGIWLIRAIQEKTSLAICSTGMVPLTGLFMSATISILLSTNQLYGFFDLFGMFLSALLFIYVASQIRTRKELVLVLTLLLANIALQGLIALGQFATKSNLGLDFIGATKELKDYASLASLSRAGGTLGHPNSLALFFDLSLPLAFSLLFVPMRWVYKLLLLFTVVIGLAGLIVTLSRGGMLAAGLAMTFLALIHLSRRLGKIQAATYVLLGVLLSGIIIFTTPNPIHQRFFQHDYGSALGRVPHMQVAFNLIRSNPFFGVGLNNYAEAAMQYDTTPQQIMAKWESPVHNLYLFIMGEIGFIGMAWVFLFFLSLMRAFWPALKSPDPFLSAVSLGALVGLLAYFFHGQFDYANWTRFTILWFFLGLLVTLGRLASMPASAR